MVCDIYIPENNQKEQRINELKTLYTLDELINHCYEEEQEVERLNNIIDKLEKAILNTYPCMNMYEQDFKSELLNILKDLKGEN